MNAYNARDLIDHFSADETIDVKSYVDDCACGCRQHYTVEHGLIHAHGRPMFDRLLVLGDLGLRGNADLLRLPNELVVTGSLYLSDCINLKVMPSQLTVGGNVDLRETRIRELPSSMAVQGDVYLDNCPDLIEIGPGVQASAIHASHWWWRFFEHFIEGKTWICISKSCQ